MIFLCIHFSSCYISDIGVFFGAFLGPIFLIIIFNTVVYSLVIRVLIKHNLQKNKHKIDKSRLTAFEVVKLMLSICGIMFLFGLTWLFAIFTFVSTNRDAAFALQFIFAFLNATQGFWIFFFFVFLNSEARESWKSLLFPCTKKEEPATSKTDLSSKNKYFTGTKRSTYSTNSSTTGTGTLEYNMKKKKMDSMDFLETPSTTIVEEDESESLPDIIINDEPEKKSYDELMREEEKEKPKETNQSLYLKARVQRHSTKRKKHEFEQVDVDFFDNDNDEDEAFF